LESLNIENAQVQFDHTGGGGAGTDQFNMLLGNLEEWYITYDEIDNSHLSKVHRRQALHQYGGPGCMSSTGHGTPFTRMENLSPLEGGLAGLTQLRSLTMICGYRCSELVDLSPLKGGLAGLTQLQSFVMD
jgi:hypothetical protein